MSSARWQVAIAGGGPAASVLAVELIRHGFTVTLFASPPTHSATAIEAIPENGVRLLGSLGFGDALRRAGAVAVRGFENAWEHQDRPLWHDGAWVHVERTRLARALLDEAIACGADVLTAVPPGPARPVSQPGAAADAPFRWELGGATLQAHAAIDATGRAARWSRPIRRGPASTATLYRGPGSDVATPGRVTRLAGGFAYRLAHPMHTTVGIVLIGQAAPDELPEQAAVALGIRDRHAFVLETRCPAHPQWTTAPVLGRRLAVGDAALAYSPLAGQGLRFATASAIAAATALAAFREGRDEVAIDYYGNFVASARARHLSRLAQLEGAAPGVSEPPLAAPLETWVRFDARTSSHAVSRSGRITMDEVVVLADGGHVRWLGAFDLLKLRDFASQARRMDELYTELHGAGLSPGDGARLLQWCLRSGVLARCSAPD